VRDDNARARALYDSFGFIDGPGNSVARFPAKPLRDLARQVSHVSVPRDLVLGCSSARRSTSRVVQHPAVLVAGAPFGSFPPDVSTAAMLQGGLAVGTVAALITWLQGAGTWWLVARCCSCGRAATLVRMQSIVHQLLTLNVQLR
jgi:hypothetical protein